MASLFKRDRKQKQRRKTPVPGALSGSVPEPVSPTLFDGKTEDETNPFSVSDDCLESNPFSSEPTLNPFDDPQETQSENTSEGAVAAPKESSNPFATEDILIDEEIKSRPEEPEIDTNTLSNTPCSLKVEHSEELIETNSGTYPIEDLKESSVEDAEFCHPAPLTIQQLEATFESNGLSSFENIVDMFLEFIRNIPKSRFATCLDNYYNASNEMVANLKVQADNLDALKAFIDKFWIFSTKTLTSTKTCGDNRNVTFTMEYEYADFSSNNFENLKATWELMYKISTAKFSNIQFQSMINWIEVEFYLNNFLTTFAAQTKVDMRTMIVSFEAASDPKFAPLLNQMRQIITVLFRYLRKPALDKNITDEVLIWAEKCCALLLRTASLYDHIFILNHSLRLPSGLSEKVTHFIHLPQINPNKSKTLVLYMDHLLTVLKFVLSPVKQRAEMLKEFERNPTVDLNADSSGDCHWILVEDDLEIIDSPSDSTWHIFHENNLIDFLVRLNFPRLLESCAVLMKRETGFLQCVAYFNHFLIPFSDCFETYQLLRYNQLNKLVSRYCVKLANFVLNSWLENFSKYSTIDSPYAKSMLVEVNAFALRSLNLLLSHKDRPAILQHLADFQFPTFIKSFSWKSVYLLTGSTQMSIEDLLQLTYDPKDLFVDLKSFTDFDAAMVEYDFAVGSCILTTLCNIVRDPSFDDEELIVYVTNCIFYSCYISPVSRERYFKHGRDLLAYLLASHVHLVSFLLNKINRNWEKVGKMILHLFNDVNLDKWVPSKADIELLLHWLEYHDAEHPLSLLARIVLSHIFWQAKNKDDKLIIAAPLQAKVLVVVLFIYNKLISSDQYDIPSEVKTVTKNPIAEMQAVQHFGSWCWKIVLELDLSSCQDLLTFKKEELLAPKGKTFPSFIALLTCNSPQHPFSFVNGGMTLLRKIVADGFLKPAVYVMYKNLSFHLTVVDELFLYTEQLSFVMQNICKGDSGFSQRVGFSPVVGDNTTLMASMLISILQAHMSYNATDCCKLLEVFVASIFSTPGYAQNFYLVYLLERLCHFGFQAELSKACLIKMFCKHVQQLQNEPERSFKIFSSEKTFQQIPSVKTFPFAGFVSYFAILAQQEFESQNDIWDFVVDKMLRDSNLTLSNAMKLVNTELNLRHSFLESNLTIYLLSDLLCFIDTKHQAYCLLWQMFFRSFLYRPKTKPNCQGNISAGDRFFANFYFTDTIKNLKRQLQVATTDWEKVMSENSSDEFSSQDSNESKTIDHFQAFLLWIDEPKLHSSSLVVRNLPDNYIPSSLLHILSSQPLPIHGTVMEFQMQEETMEMMKIWHNELYTHFSKPMILLEPFDNSTIGINHRIERIKTKFFYKELHLPKFRHSLLRVALIDKSLLISKRDLLQTFHENFQVFSDFARACVTNWSQIEADFDKYTKIARKQFENKLTTITKVMNCESMFQRYKCTGPVVFDLAYKCKSEILTVSFEMDSTWKGILEKLNKKSDVHLNTFASVKSMELVITGLISLNESSPDLDKEITRTIGIDLFFLIANLIQEELLHFIPFKTIVEDQLRLLGDKFVSFSGDSQSHLLDLMLAKPFLLPTISDYFNPVLAVGMFCAFYETISSKVVSDFDKAISEMLLTKFDVKQWLLTKPSAEKRSSLLSSIFNVLYFCGQNIAQEYESTFNCCRKQAKVFLQVNVAANFPSYFESLLALSINQKAHVALWEDISEVSGMERIDLSLSLGEIYGNLMSTQEIQSNVNHFPDCNFITEICTTFSQTRLNNSVSLVTLFGPYLLHLSKSLIFLGRIIIEITTEIVKDTESCTVQIWDALVKLFSGFIAPIELEESGKLLLPFEQTAKKDSSSLVCHAFTVCLFDAIKTREMSLQKSLRLDTLNNKTYLRLFLHYFSTVLCKTDKSYIMEQYHVNFLKLPWFEFVPDIYCTDLIQSVLEFSDSCVDAKEFVCQVFISANWRRYCDEYCFYDGDVGNAALSKFLRLSIVVENNAELKEESTALIVNYLNSLQHVNWSKLTPENFEIGLNFFFKRHKRRTVSLKEPSGSFSLLINISGLQSEDLISTFAQKSLMMTFLCKHILNVSQTDLSEIVTELLKCVSLTMDLNRDPAGAVLLLMSCIAKLINTQEPSLQIGACLKGFTTWAYLPEAYHFVLLFAVTCGQNFAVTDTLAHYLESAVDAYFNNPNASEFDWSILLNYIELPLTDKAQLLSVCSNNGFYYLLYIYILQLRNNSGEQMVTQICAWLGDVVNLETATEAKLFLLFAKVLEHLEKILFSNTATKFVNNCRSVVYHLSELNREKSSLSMVMSKIGLGSPKVSQKFVVSCKCIMLFLQYQIESMGQDIQGDCSIKSFPASAILAELTPFLNSKNYPDIAGKLQNIFETELQTGMPMDKWPCLTKILVQEFYPEYKSLSVLL